MRDLTRRIKNTQYCSLRIIKINDGLGSIIRGNLSLKINHSNHDTNWLISSRLIDPVNGDSVLIECAADIISQIFIESEKILKCP